MLTVISLAVAFTVNPQFLAVAASYVVLLALYSLSLKHLVILDVLTLAGGFVLRAIGGAVAIDVAFSHWLLLLTLLLALFLGLSKRRAELVTLAADARDHRPILADYSPYLLDQMIGVVTASTLLAYAFYTISPETIAKFGTDKLLLHGAVSALRHLSVPLPGASARRRRQSVGAACHRSAAARSAWRCGAQR